MVGEDLALARAPAPAIRVLAGGYIADLVRGPAPETPVGPQPLLRSNESDGAENRLRYCGPVKAMELNKRPKVLQKNARMGVCVRVRVRVSVCVHAFGVCMLAETARACVCVCVCESRV